MLKIDFLIVSHFVLLSNHFTFTIQCVHFTSSSFFFLYLCLLWLLFSIFLTLSLLYSHHHRRRRRCSSIRILHSIHTCACAGARAYKRKPVIKRNNMFSACECVCVFVCVREHRITKINLCKITKVCVCAYKIVARTKDKWKRA